MPALDKRRFDHRVKRENCVIKAMGVVGCVHSLWRSAVAMRESGSDLRGVRRTQEKTLGTRTTEKLTNRENEEEEEKKN